MTPKHPMPASGWLLGFHGTTKDFSAFTEEDSLGKGGDANSHLGVHLAHAAQTAVGYALQSREDLELARKAGPQVLVHLVAYPQGSSYGSSHEEFFCQTLGGDPNDDPRHPLYLALDDTDEDADPVGRFREWLLAGGYRTVERDDVEGAGAHIIVLRPEDAIIVGTVRGADAIQALANLDEQLRSEERLSDFERFGRLQEAVMACV